MKVERIHNQPTILSRKENIKSLRKDGAEDERAVSFKADKKRHRHEEEEEFNEDFPYADDEPKQPPSRSSSGEESGSLNIVA